MQKKMGFTLIEIIVSVAIVGLIMLIIVSVIKSNTQVWLKSNQMRDVQQGARPALQRMISEMRQAGYIYGNTPVASGGNGPAINTAGANTITFCSVVRDVNFDGAKSTFTWNFNVDRETTTFSVANSRVHRQSITATGTDYMDLTFPAVKVISLDFVYRYSTGTILGFPITGDDRYDIGYVEIELNVGAGAGQAGAAAGRETIILKGGTSLPNFY